MKTPTISAVVPVYNAERYVGEALTAILSQTRPPDEVIVVDDGSTDGTLGELERFRGEIRVVRQGNLGVAGAMNRCFEEARCDYVAKCDADDIWEPDKLERQIRGARSPIPRSTSPSAAPASSAAATAARRLIRAPASSTRKSLREHLYRANFVCSCSTLVRRSLHQRLGPFVEGLDLRGLRLLAACRLRPEQSSSMTRRVLVNYRTHENQVSGNLLRMHRAEYMPHGWHADLVGDARLVRKVQARDLSNIARQLSDEDRPREARA